MKKHHQPNAIDKLKLGLADKGVSVRSIVAVIVFGMIVLTFVLTDLTGRHHSGNVSGAAAEVNGEIISLKDFQQEENKVSQFYSQIYGGQFDAGKERAQLRTEALRNLVSMELASQAAEKEGIYATDAEVRHVITTEIPAFKQDGGFQSDNYKSVLAANRLTPGEFEKRIRQQIKTQRSRQLFEAALSKSDLQKKADQELKSIQVDLDYVIIDAKEYEKHHPVSEAVIKSKLADADFSKKVEDYFKTHESEFSSPEKVKASHILIRTFGNAEQDQKAKEKAEAVLKRLSKEDFAKVASQVSDDPGSKSKGGDLGYFSKGQMVKEFDDAVFSLAPGKVSSLVKTQYGYHIIKVTDKKPAVTADLEKSKKEIATKLIQEDEFTKFASDLEKKISDGKMDEAVALLKENHFDWKNTGYFKLSSDTIPGISSPQAMKEAMQLSQQNPMAKKLIREGDQQFLLKFKGTREEDAAVAAKAAVAPEVDQSRISANDIYNQWVDNFRKSVKVDVNNQLLKE